MADETPTPPPAKKSSGCLKGCLIAGVILLVVAAVGGFIAYRAVSKKISQYTPLLNSLATSPTPASSQITLTIESGTVVGHTTGDTLKNGAAIKTGPDSQATINFPSGSQLRLDSNTQITINQPAPNQLTIFQSLGRTWSRVVNLATGGSYEVETPTALATVRGTAFSTSVTGSDTQIDTDQNSVEVAAIEHVGKGRQIIQKIIVDQGHSTKINKSDLADLKLKRKQLIKEVTPDAVKNSDWHRKNQQRDLGPKTETNPLGDLATLQRLAQRAQSKDFQLSPSQLAKLEALGKRIQGRGDKPTAADIAEALSIIYPEEFSDTAHWTQVLQNYQPLLDSFSSLAPIPTP